MMESFIDGSIADHKLYGRDNSRTTSAGLTHNLSLPVFGVSF
jgi:hypothetical protein